MAHRTVRCASHVTRPLGSDRWSSGVWARLAVRWHTGQSTGALDKSCRLCGVPPVRALLLCVCWRAFNVLQSIVVREVAVASLAHRTVRCAPDMSGEL